jgi:hypothetical protein
VIVEKAFVHHHWVTRLNDRSLVPPRKGERADLVTTCEFGLTGEKSHIEKTVDLNEIVTDMIKYGWRGGILHINPILGLNPGDHPLTKKSKRIGLGEEIWIVGDWNGVNGKESRMSKVLSH